MSDTPQTAVPRVGERLFVDAPKVRHTSALATSERTAIRDLMDVAFAGDFYDADFDHALGGVHAIVTDPKNPAVVVGHASVVQRQVLVDDVPARCGYVEAVAVHPDWGRRGIGGQLMAVVENVIVGAYDIGALSASDQGRELYLRRGWRVWEGRLGVLSPDGYRPTPDDEGGVMVYRPVQQALTGRLAADWRAGDIW